jgi:hypothetical protein
VKEISVILKNNVLITIEEFKILDRYACPGKMWTLVQRPPEGNPHVITQRTIEYIFDNDTLTFFGVISTNILAYWDTDVTKNLAFGQEYQIKDTLFIRHYYKP